MKGMKKGRRKAYLFPWCISNAVPHGWCCCWVLHLPELAVTVAVIGKRGNGLSFAL